jgi:hypothetical protein
MKSALHAVLLITALIGAPMLIIHFVKFEHETSIFARSSRTVTLN